MKKTISVHHKPLEFYFALEPLWLKPLSAISQLFHGPAPTNARRLMIAMMAKLADADGVRQPQETELLDDCLTRWFGENQDSKIQAFRMLREIRSSSEPFESYAKKFAKAFSWSLSMRANAFDALCSIAVADGVLELPEDKLLRAAATLFEIPETEVRRLRQHYASISSSRPRDSQQRTTEQQEGRKAPPTFTTQSYHWSQALGCQPGANLAEVKRAYRKLVMLYHPDRLKSHGLPSEQLQAATERFLRIQSAYEEAMTQLER